MSNKVLIRTAGCLLIVRQKRAGNDVNNEAVIDLKPIKLPDSVFQYIESMSGDDEVKETMKWEFNNHCEVLWGQGEVINWLKSTSDDKLKIMSYPGEYKLPGGTKEKNETLKETAVREAEEELHIQIPETAIIRPLKQVSTRVVRNKQFIMCAFVALEDENPWISEISVDDINRKLETRENQFQELKKESNFWEEWNKLTAKEKETLSPEVKEVKWFDLKDSYKLCLTSKSTLYLPVNDYQKTQFLKYKITKRDPLMATLFILAELGNCTDFDEIRTFAADISFPRL